MWFFQVRLVIVSGNVRMVVVRLPQNSEVEDNEKNVIVVVYVYARM